MNDAIVHAEYAENLVLTLSVEGANGLVVATGFTRPPFGDRGARVFLLIEDERDWLPGEVSALSIAVARLAENAEMLNERGSSPPLPGETA